MDMFRRKGKNLLHVRKPRIVIWVKTLVHRVGSGPTDVTNFRWTTGGLVMEKIYIPIPSPPPFIR